MTDDSTDSFVDLWDTFTDREKAIWVAALWEGEGTTRARSESGDTKRSNGVEVSISMTDREPLDRVCEFLGGKVNGPYTPPSRLEYKPLWVWGIRNWNGVEHFYNVVCPYLSAARRIEQWAAVMDQAIPVERRGRGLYQKVTTECRKGHEYTPENTIITADGHRHCRACRDAAHAARYAKATEGLVVRSLGAHRNWHEKRGIVHPACIHCGTAPWDVEPPAPHPWGKKKNPDLVTAESMHKRWHVNRDLVHPNCIWCGTAEGEPYKQPPRSAETRARLAEAQRNTQGWGSHIRWHVNRGIVHENCVHCGTAELPV